MAPSKLGFADSKNRKKDAGNGTARPKRRMDPEAKRELKAKLAKKDEDEGKIVINGRIFDRKRVMEDDIIESGGSDVEVEQMKQQRVRGVNLDADEKDRDNFEKTETAQQTKLRLAKMYIDQVRKKVKLGLGTENEEDLVTREDCLERITTDKDTAEDREDDDGDDVESEDEDVKIARELRYQVAKKSGHIIQPIASIIAQRKPRDGELGVRKYVKGHKNCVLCACASSDGLYLYTGGRDSSIIKWSMDPAAENPKLWTIKGFVKKDLESGRKFHRCQINSLAVSHDSKFLASAGNDPEVFIWNPSDGSFLYKLSGHRSSVLALGFKPYSYQLFSASSDRFVKVWQVDDKVTLDNLCGHECDITGLDVSTENPITVGSNDKCIRLWKIAASSQLVFHHQKPLDCVVFLKSKSADTFATGDQEGCVALWSTQKKKPLFKEMFAHKDSVTFLSAVRSSDVLASASRCSLKIWKMNLAGKASLELLWELQPIGYVNFVFLSPDLSQLVVGLGVNPKSGKFNPVETCKRGLHFYKLADFGESNSTETSRQNNSTSFDTNVSPD